MARNGRGLICLSMTPERLDELEIPLMVSQNTSRFETAFCVPVESKSRTTTGISARDRAATVLLCTHDLQEAEVLCDRVVVIDQGRVLADGTPAELIRMHAGTTDGSLEDAFMQLTGKRLEEDEEEKEE